MNHLRNRNSRFPAAIFLAGGIAIPAILPVCALATALFSPRLDIWHHLAGTILPDVIRNTVGLVLIVACGSGVLGVGLAWLVETCEFPFRRVLGGMLLLPLALPTYVTAFVYNGWMAHSGPVQTLLRNRFPDLMGTGFEFRTVWGVGLVLILSLTPYVYLLSGTAFRTQGIRLQEAARTLGMTRTGATFRVVLPHARPWIAAGILLVVMETMADFGAVAIFNFDTMTTAIYKAWYGFFSIEAAAQLSLVLVGGVFAVAMIEARMRSRMRFHRSTTESEQPIRTRLTGWKSRLAVGGCLTVIMAGFGLPVCQLALWGGESARETLHGGYVGYLQNTLVLGGVSTGGILLAGMILAMIRRRREEVSPIVRLAMMGYAVPGTVLAVGMVFVAGGIDRLIGVLFGDGLWLQGSAAMLVIGYGSRFLAVGYQPVSSALERIPNRLDDVAATLGCGQIRKLTAIHLPLIRSGLLTGLLLVFVEVMKEMPATLMLRPFGWDTLAVKVFEFTSEGEWERAALPALAIVLAGLLPIGLLMKERMK